MPTQKLLSQSRFFQGGWGGSGFIRNAYGDGSGNLYALDSNGTLHGYRLDSGATLVPTGGSTVTTNANDVAIVVLAGMGSAFTCGSTTTAHLVELSSFYASSVTPWVSVKESGGTTPKAQQLAFSPAASTVMSVTNTNGEVAYYNAATGLANSVTLSGYSAQPLHTIVNMGTSGHFLVGTGSGVVLEVNATGGVVSNLVISPTPSSVTISGTGSGTVGSWPISSLYYYNDACLISSAAGVIYNYKWSTKSFVEMYLGGSAGDGLVIGGVQFNDPAGCIAQNSYVFYTKFGNADTTRNNSYIHICSITPFGKLRKIGIFRTQTSDASSSLGYDSSVNQLWLARNATQNLEMTFYLVPVRGSTGSTTVPTRVQNPPGTDVAARIIRIVDPGVGRAYVYSDQNISAGQVSLNADTTAEYYELAIISGSSTLWDWRKFNC